MVRPLSKVKCDHMAEALLSVKIDRKAVHIGNANHIRVCVYILYLFCAFIWCCHHNAALCMAGLHMKVSRFVAVFNQSIKGFCF